MTTIEEPKIRKLSKAPVHKEVLDSSIMKYLSGESDFKKQPQEKC